MVKQNFGGDWTEEKLDRIRKYLAAYTIILSRYDFEYAYIDAFAGTGYRIQESTSNVEDSNQLLITDFLTDNTTPDATNQDVVKFIEGSARISLQIEPEFKKYIFIEKHQKKVQELHRLKEEFQNKNIQIINEDANKYVQSICNKDWSQHRAVMFLDPYGMQVSWNTIQAIASTKAIDLWYLFPLMAVNRLLKRDGQILDSHRILLNNIFGTETWYDAFYQTRGNSTLFGDYSFTAKTATGQTIGQYFVDRLRNIFSGVADNPLILYNSYNSPLFLLCFAAGNPRGAKTAIKIAKHILKK